MTIPLTRFLSLMLLMRSKHKGAFNSEFYVVALLADLHAHTLTGWDRLPYITDIRDGQNPSTVPAMNDVGHNFIVANYAADGGCLDVRPLSPFTRPVRAPALSFVPFLVPF